MSENFIRIDNTSEEVQKMLKKDGIVKQNEQTNEDQKTRIKKLEDQHLDKTYIPLSEKDNLATKKELNEEVTELNKKIDSLPSGGGGEVVVQGVGKEGEGANAEIFNDYENNQALADFSTAKGYKTQAGAKCFRLDTSYQYTDKETELGFYVIPYQKDGITQEMRNAWTQAINSEQGLRYTIVLTSNYDLQGKVTSSWDLWDEVNKWGFYVTNFVAPSTDPSSPAYLNENSYIFFPDYPWIGIDTIGTGADASGYETQALAVGSRSGGLRTKAIGKYGDASGRDTIAGYAAEAGGKETVALGENSKSHGCRTTVLGFAGSIEGSSTNRAFDHIYDENGKLLSDEEIIQKYKEKPFSLSKGNNTRVEGKDNLGLRSHQHIEGEGNIGLTNHVHIQGKYAEIDYNNEYLDIVGNGADDENRKNIRTLDKEGNGWYAKDVYIRGKTFKDTSLTLNKDVPFGGYNYKEDFSSMPIYFSSNKIPADVIGNQYNSSGQKIVYTTGGTFDSSLENLPVELLGDGTFRLQQTLDRSARYKFFDFFGTKERFTQDDIGRKFVISIRYKYENGHVRFGLMSKATGSYYTKFYETKGVITLKNTEWTVSTLEVTVDEQMVKEQIGLVTIDFAQVGSIIVDYIESVEVKTFEEVLNNKADKEYVDKILEENKFINNQLVRMVTGTRVNVAEGAIEKPTMLKIYGETIRKSEPTFNTPSNIETVKDVAFLLENGVDAERYIEFPFDLCEGDYVQVDYKSKKLIHYKTKAKWTANEYSIIHSAQSGELSYYQIEDNIDGVEGIYEMSREGYSNVFGAFNFVSGEGIYVSINGEFNGYTSEDIKQYLLDNNAVAYFDLDEPIITEYDFSYEDDYPSYVWELASVFEQSDDIVYVDSNGIIEASYIADINLVLDEIKQENKRYLDEKLGEINAALDAILSMQNELLGGGQ